MKNVAYCEGWDAHGAGKRLTQNPYYQIFRSLEALLVVEAEGTPNPNRQKLCDWRSGWIAAHKQRKVGQ